jgi:hypothetical protein
MHNSTKLHAGRFAMAAVLIAGFALSAWAQIQPVNQQVQPVQLQRQMQGPAQGQAAQVPQGPPMICGNQALCEETADFAATITSFRVSTTYNKQRIFDLTVRFQNKTNQQLILGYVNQSGNITDDRGNRAIPWGPKAYLGIGLVVGGTNFDPRFVLRSGSWGDAQFEFLQQGYPQLIGFTFSLDLAISEINSYEGNQHTLGGEYPLHFEGLRNGVASASPLFSPGSVGNTSNSMASALSNPCGTAGALAQGNSTAATAVSDANNAISAITSIWHRKKKATAPSTTPGCNPGATATTAAPAAATPIPTAVPTQPAALMTSTATPAVMQPAVVHASSKAAVMPAATATPRTPVRPRRVVRPKPQPAPVPQQQTSPPAK